MIHWCCGNAAMKRESGEKPEQNPLLWVTEGTTSRAFAIGRIKLEHPICKEHESTKRNPNPLRDNPLLQSVMEWEGLGVRNEGWQVRRPADERYLLMAFGEMELFQNFLFLKFPRWLVAHSLYTHFPQARIVRKIFSAYAILQMCFFDDMCCSSNYNYGSQYYTCRACTSGIEAR